MTVKLKLKNNQTITIHWAEKFVYSGDTAIVKTFGNEPKVYRNVDLAEADANNS